MFGSSFGDLVLRRVLNHRTHCSRSRLTFAMRMPSSSLMYAEVWSRFPYKLPSLDVCRSRSGLPVKCVLRCCGRSHRVNSGRSLGNLPKTKSIHLHGLSKVVVVGFCAWAPFHIVSLLHHTSFTSAFAPGPAHQPCTAHGRLERNASLVAVGSLTTAMSVAMLLMQVPSMIGGRCVNHRVLNLASDV